MKVPFLDLKAQYSTIKKEISVAIQDVLESQQFILGPKVEEFERNIAAYTGTKYAVGVSSGTDALLVSLMALGIKPGDEVITTSFSFFATAGAVARLGATPVFVDIDALTYKIDPANIEPAITKKTKAIIPVHLFGQCADMDRLLKIAKKHKLYVIEDAAQSLGAEYPLSFPRPNNPAPLMGEDKGGGELVGAVRWSRGRKAGSMGDLGIFSFFPTKNLGGFGDGGMVVTNDEKLYEKIRILRVHGAEQRYYHKMIGGNFRLDAIQAAVLNVKLKYLDQWSEKRRENAEYYNRKFEEAGLVEKAGRGLPQPKYSSPLGGEDKGGGESVQGSSKDCPSHRGCIFLPVAVYKNSCVKNYHIYNQYTIQGKNRDELKSFLEENGVACGIYYPVPLHQQRCFKDVGYKKRDLPISERICKNVLSLPIYPELKDEQKTHIVNVISEFYEKEN